MQVVSGLDLSSDATDGNASVSGCGLSKSVSQPNSQPDSGYRVFRARILSKARRRIAILATLMLVSPFFTITIGPAAVPIKEVFSVLLSHIPNVAIEVTWSPAVDAIVWVTRFPRIVAGLGIGAILGVSGVIFQALVRNSLAEPYVLGVSSGASTGAAVAIVLIGSGSAIVLNATAFFGALVATFLVTLIAGGTHSTPLHLILAGLSVGFGFQALTNLLIFFSGSPETSRAVMFWMLGSLGRASWNQALLVLTAAVLLTGVAVFISPILDALASGDRTAQSVGIEPNTARMLILIPVSAAVAMAVAASGGIGFVGLIIPHVIRAFLGHAHRYLVLGCAFASGLFLVWADAFARIAFAPAEIPIGVITGLVGCPFLIVLIRKSKKLAH